jgi:hypothetical protein
MYLTLHVCIYPYACTYVRTCVLYIRTCVLTSVRVYLRPYVCAYVRTCVLTSVRVCLRPYVCAFVRTCVLTSISLPSIYYTYLSQMSIKKRHQYVCIILIKYKLILTTYPKRVTRFYGKQKVKTALGCDIHIRWQTSADRAFKFETRHRHVLYSCTDAHLNCAVV